MRSPSLLYRGPSSVKYTSRLVPTSAAHEQVLKVSVITAATHRSAPEADVAHGLAGGAALCGREVDLAAGADTHLVHGL